MTNSYVALGISLVLVVVLLVMLTKYNDWDILWYSDHKEKKHKGKK